VKKSDPVFYIDPFGRDHVALVFALNGLNPGYLSVVYIDQAAPENDNLKRVFDIPHMTDDSRQETRTVPVSDPQARAAGEVVVDGNPDLPTYHVNCWKEIDEDHRRLPQDHPAFDHPFAAPETDKEGQVIPKSRPEYEADVRRHQARPTLVELAEALSSVPSQPFSGGKSVMDDDVAKMLDQDQFGTASDQAQPPAKDKPAE